MHPSLARERVRAGAERAVRKGAAGELRPLVIEPPVVIEIEFRDAGEADHAAIVPGVQRAGDRGVRIEAADAPTAYRGFLAAVRLAGLVEMPAR
jgi:D-aminopeptidase